MNFVSRFTTADSRLQ